MAITESALNTKKNNKRLGSQWRLFGITFFTISIVTLTIGCSNSEVELDPCGTPRSPWDPGPTPVDGWTVPSIYQKAVEDEFSGAVLVRHRGEVLLDSAAGFADREAEIPYATNTVSTMASITKQYTAALVMSLQEAGLLGVDDRLSDHFPNVPEDKADITIHQLLTHTSGFRSNLGNDNDPIGRDEFLELAWSSTLGPIPGEIQCADDTELDATDYSYSNAGFSIATAIVEQVTGQSYEVALRERLFTPVGIAETGNVLPDWSGRSIAIGYSGAESLDSFGAPWADDGPYWHLRGNGGMLSTTSDMMKWHDALSGTELLGTSSINSLQAPHVGTGIGPSSYYGYGWNIEDTPSGKLVWHNGGNGFHFAQFLRFIDENLVIVVLSNEDAAVSFRLAQNIAGVAVPSLAGWSLP